MCIVLCIEKRVRENGLMIRRFRKEANGMRVTVGCTLIAQHARLRLKQCVCKVLFLALRVRAHTCTAAAR
jgi:hypothetical protein